MSLKIVRRTDKYSDSQLLPLNEEVKKDNNNHQKEHTIRLKAATEYLKTKTPNTFTAPLALHSYALRLWRNCLDSSTEEEIDR